MKFGSLFSGIGGIDLGLDRAGLECAFQVENEPYCLNVLAKHWPNVTRYEDIREVDFARVEPVELLAGGFPCQDLSYAGKGAGLSGERSGLWSEYVTAIRVVRPRYVLVENVPGLLGRGMGVVLGDLSALGYDAEWESVPAAAFGAPHLRWRVFIVAYACSSRFGWSKEQTLREGWQQGRQRQESLGNDFNGLCMDVADAGRQRNERRGEAGDLSGLPREAQGERLQRQRGGDSTLDSSADVPDTELQRLQGCSGSRSTGERRTSSVFARDRARPGGEWPPEPDVGRVANGVPNRIHKLRGLGNAVVPQVAQWLGERIIEHELWEEAS